MGSHLIGFYESQDPAGAYVGVAAVADETIRVNGDFVTIPDRWPNIVALAAGIELAAEAFPRFSTPTLRGRSRLYVEPFNIGSAAAVEPNSPHRVADYRLAPIALVPGESLLMEIDSNPAAAQVQWGLVWLADQLDPAPAGERFSIRATNGSTLVAGAWTNGALTFPDELPRGRYAIVGMRARAAGLIAARLVNPSGGFRPGVMGVDAQDDLEHPMFRDGGLGNMMEFEDDEPPSVDFLSASGDTAQDVILDVVQVRGGPR